MKKVVSISFGEIALKGANRGFFENQLIRKIRFALRKFENIHVSKDQGKLYIEPNPEDIEEIIKRVRKVFGIVYVSPCYKIEKDMDSIREAAVYAMKQEMENGKSSFKVDTKRADKRYPIKSPDISRDIGGYILENLEGSSVDIHNPDTMVYVDIRTSAYVYTEKHKGYGGLPVGTNGKGLLLLSGGIDSPVAGFLMAKRGVEVHAIHFHSYPFTSERAEEKVKELANIISLYCGNMKLYSVNLLNIQKEINKNCPEDEMTIISRRFMMRIAEAIAKREGMDALITGESLGQVASQTIQGINVTNSSVSLPVLRPLIGTDKTDIVEISKDIETYETSILPFEDCCTVFLPKHPVTKPKLEDIEESESVLDVEGLVKSAVESAELEFIK
ncbi:putative tRNA sulfurtransferase [Andreesenia angusta]|uniref:Probable tRNA sulfurtransferase n=1 Tax=Andreesenia angusta TaxID=39480 RepID=A0A1S1V6K7_9FIRM|nr:tRNA uracil 4-sulfurtransferase ThiI [Andreesenia angusta]OHW62144.1 putative tRNA sulfurtransferase [Andreesenia angusta]